MQKKKKKSIILMKRAPLLIMFLNGRLNTRVNFTIQKKVNLIFYLDNNSITVTVLFLLKLKNRYLFIMVQLKRCKKYRTEPPGS